MTTYTAGRDLMGQKVKTNKFWNSEQINKLNSQPEISIAKFDKELQQ